MFYAGYITYYKHYIQYSQDVIALIHEYTFNLMKFACNYAS